MKKLFTLLAMLTCVAISYAQHNLVATLNHNDTISAYYGANALKNAHSAAVDGDVITLSSGTFLATNITKGITLRGAGAWPDTVAKRMPTVIAGDFKIGSSNIVTKGLTLEGIYHNATISCYSMLDISLLKCRFKYINSASGDTDLRNAIVVHCCIADGISCGVSTISFVNCLIDYASNSAIKGGCEFNNCLIRLYDGRSLYNSTFSNCVIYQKDPTSYVYSTEMNTSSLAYNCVNPDKVDYSDHFLFKNIPNTTNVYSTSNDVFKTYRGGGLMDKDSPDLFELTDSAKTTLLGTDGTQVGIYGGDFPFDPTVSVPQITKFEVAKQSTAEGKLNIDIEVNAAAVEPKK